MFKYITSFLWGANKEAEAPLSLDEAYDLIQECKPSQIKQKPEKEENAFENIESYEVFNKTGKVTHTFGDHYRVDDLYDFETDTDGIYVGTKVSYQLIKSEGEIRVLDVQVEDNDWNGVETGKRKWSERTVICKVIEREGRSLILEPGQIKIDLNKVSSEFIPIVGDWVELVVKCQIDESVVDLSGKILEVTKLNPVRCQIKPATVSLWNRNTNSGLLDRNIYFDIDSLYCGYCPIKGDKVVAEVIESSQGKCTWRALKIVPENSNFRENKINSNPKTDNFLDFHEDVEITDNISLTFTKLNEAKLFLVVVTPHKKLTLVSVEVPKIGGKIKLVDSIDYYILEEKPLTLRFECRAKSAGESRELLVFHFEEFKIKRWVNISVVYNPPTQRRNYAPKQVVSRSQRDTIRGQPVHASARFSGFNMPDFKVPEKLLTFLTQHRDETVNIYKNELETMKPCLITTLSYMNYEDRFHTLLHLDEIQVVLEMQNYDRERACFVKCGEFLLLEIDNLSERRPSVIIGDRVIIRSITDAKAPNYEGVIHKTTKNHVYCKFSQIFHDSYDGEDYSIYIVASRTTYRREHYAISLAVRNLGREWLFPTKIIEKEPQIDFVFDDYSDSTPNHTEVEIKPPNVLSKQRLLDKIQQFNDSGGEELPVLKLEWYNTTLNFYQKEAVRNILLGVCRPLPYIIFGPPGTGKTVTIVETVLQILRMVPHSRILVSAPSNSAADLLALRLVESGVLRPGDLIRLVAFSAISSIPSKLAPYCATGSLEREGTETSLPVVTPSGLVLGYSCAVVGRHRITVTTCSSAGLLYSMGFSKGHFSHVVVDEAGQTSEPSVLIPLSFLDTSNGQAILAGDPMQLGPVVQSRLAKEYGLDESFLERMTSRFPYMRDTQGFPKTFGFDPRLLTKLIYNYRSLPILLKLPSLLFYNDDLKATISDVEGKEISILHQLKDMLPLTQTGQTPCIVFHGIFGENYQSEDTPSWYNVSEASQVFYYVNELYRLGLQSGDVGIITPYKAQIKQLMELFSEAEFDTPKVGTVEEFQGQEFNVIILSTVRSNKRYLNSDLKFSLGFLASPRRLNVSITRAKALLIIVGNPNLLSTDRCWRSVINYCQENGAFVGNQDS